MIIFVDTTFWASFTLVYSEFAANDGNTGMQGQKGYRLKESSFTPKTPTQKQKDPGQRARVPQASGSSNSVDCSDEVADTIAYKIAEAEAKSFLAAEAVKEAEKVISMHEEAQALLRLTEEIYERCK